MFSISMHFSDFVCLFVFFCSKRHRTVEAMRLGWVGLYIAGAPGVYGYVHGEIVVVVDGEEEGSKNPKHEKNNCICHVLFFLLYSVPLIVILRCLAIHPSIHPSLPIIYCTFTFQYPYIRLNSLSSLV